MKLFRNLATAFSLVVLFALVAPAAMADDWNRKTTVTFSEPIEVPGVGQHILPAGTYVFKILDSQGERHIVQIFNARDGPRIHHHHRHSQLSPEDHRQDGHHVQ